jgi:hypothetical protein
MNLHIRSPEYEKVVSECRLSLCLYTVCVDVRFSGWTDFIHIWYSRVYPSEVGAR